MTVYNYNSIKCTKILPVVSNPFVISWLQCFDCFCMMNMRSVGDGVCSVDGVAPYSTAVPLPYDSVLQ